MKNVFNWLLVAVCLFTVGNAHVMASNEEKKEEVKVSIPISTGGVVTGEHHRELINVLFTAYYQSGIIYITPSVEFPSIIIYVKNETTGQVWNATTDVSDGMGEISIANGGAGSYTVEIVTEYGDCFVGSFGL